MTKKRKVELFTADCPVCRETISKIEAEGCCDSCDTEIVNTREAAGAERAKALGISSVPAVVVDGELLSCCKAGGIDMETLKQACR